METYPKGMRYFCIIYLFGVGNGTQVLFWKDHWDGSDTFQAKYPELFSFARDKDARVANYMECLHVKVI